MPHIPRTPPPGLAEVRRQLKRWLGAALVRAAPGRAAAIGADLAKPYWDGASAGSPLGRRVDALIRAHLADAAQRADGGRALEAMHKRQWREQRDAAWFERTAAAFDAETLPRVREPVAALAAVLEGRPLARVCEIGTGDGRFLDYLRRTLDRPATYVGLDLSAARTAVNASLYPHATFVCADATAWIRDNPVDATLYVTHGGVFEYLSPASLASLLAVLAQAEPHSLLALFHEPLSPSHDLAHDPASCLTTAGEYSYSHNYPALLSGAGFTVLHQSETDAPGYRAFTAFAAVGARS